MRPNALDIKAKLYPLWGVYIDVNSLSCQQAAIFRPLVELAKNGALLVKF